MEWTALSFVGKLRALLHIVSRAWVIPAVGHRPARPRLRMGHAVRVRIAPLWTEPRVMGHGLEIVFFKFQ